MVGNEKSEHRKVLKLAPKQKKIRQADKPTSRQIYDWDVEYSIFNQYFSAKVEYGCAQLTPHEFGEAGIEI